ACNSNPNQSVFFHSPQYAARSAPSLLNFGRTKSERQSLRGCDQPRRWLGGTTELCANNRCDARRPMWARDLEWTRFHGLLDSSCAADRDAGTYIATSRAMRMAT